MGSHDNAVRCVEYSNEVNVVLSGGWDGNVKMWDTRSSQCVGTLPQPDKVNFNYISTILLTMLFFIINFILKCMYTLRIYIVVCICMFIVFIFRFSL